MTYYNIYSYFKNIKKEDIDSEFLIDNIINKKWFVTYNQDYAQNINDIIVNLKLSLNKLSSEQKNKLFNYVFTTTDIIFTHYYYIFIDDIFKDNHEEMKNKIDINDDTKISRLFYLPIDYGFTNKYINIKLLDKQLAEIFKKLQIINYKIFSNAMIFGYIECVKYFFDQKILIKDNLILIMMIKSPNYFHKNWRYGNNFYYENFIPTFTNLIKIIQEYHNITYEEMLALLINKIPIDDISGFELDNTFYKLNSIYNVYKIQKNDNNENALELLCKTNPKAQLIRKIINKKRNPIKPTQKCLENLATYGTCSNVLSLILDNSNCILTEDLMIKFETNKNNTISTIIRKKYIEQLIELKINNKNNIVINIEK